MTTHTAKEELQKAYIRSAEGQLDVAISHCLKAQELAPDSPMPATLQASFHSTMGNHKQATKLLRSVLRKHPEFALAHLYLSEAHFLSGRRQQGLASLEAAERYDIELSLTDLIDSIRSVFVDLTREQIPTPLVVKEESS